MPRNLDPWRYTRPKLSRPRSETNLWLRREALPALLTASRYHCASAARAHPGTKSVPSLATSILGLISAFHNVRSDRERLRMVVGLVKASIRPRMAIVPSARPESPLSRLICFAAQDRRTREHYDDANLEGHKVNDSMVTPPSLISDKSVVRLVLSFLMRRCAASYNSASLAKNFPGGTNNFLANDPEACGCGSPQLWIGLWTSWNEAEDS